MSPRVAAVTSQLTVRPVLRAEIMRELDAFFAKQQPAATAYGAEFAHLWALAAEHVKGGKLVRPVLMVETFEALSGPGALERATVVRLAAAIELLHYSFLLHDDVIDGDLMRRGRPNLIGALLTEAGDERAIHWARTGGLLMGDLLLSATHQMIARVDLSMETRIRLLDLLEHTILESVAGEHMDVALSDGVVTPDLNAVLTMSARKTATYTFELPLRAAAILAGATAEAERALTTAGYHLGLAFQLQDDLLSMFGDQAEHGKDAFSDLREGKHTAIMTYARLTSAWPSIEADFGNPDLTTDRALRVRELLRHCGAERFVRSLVAEQTSAFYEAIAGSGNAQPVPAAARSVLLSIAAELEERRS